MTRMEETMKETREMMRQVMQSWSSAQRKMIDQWLDVVEGYDDRPAGNLWDQTLSIWESSVKRTVEAQNATMSSWMSQLQEMDEMPGDARKRVEEGKALMKQWTETQNDLWAKWFDTMRQMDPGRYEASWREMVKHSTSVWRDYAERIQQLSDEFAGMASEPPGSENA